MGPKKKPNKQNIKPNQQQKQRLRSVNPSRPVPLMMSQQGMMVPGPQMWYNSDDPSWGGHPASPHAGRAPINTKCKFESQPKGCRRRDCPFLHTKSKKKAAQANNNLNISEVSEAASAPNDSDLASTSNSISLPEPSPTVLTPRKHKVPDNSTTAEDTQTPNKKAKLDSLPPKSDEAESSRVRTLRSSTPVTISNKQESVKPDLVTRNEGERYKVMRSFSKSTKGLPHMKKISIDEGDVVTIKGKCSNKEHPNCSFLEVKNIFKGSGFVPCENLGSEVLEIKCPLCSVSEIFKNEPKYLEHLCMEHFYSKLEKILKGNSLFKCPETLCGKSCSSLRDLILHYGATAHENVLYLLLDSLQECKTTVDESVTHELSEKTHEIETLKKDFKEMEVERDELDSEAMDLKTEKEAILKELEKEKTAKEKWQKMAETQKSRILEKNKSINDLQQELKGTVSKAEHQKIIDEFKEQLESKENDLKIYKDDHEAMENERDELDAKVVELEQKLQTKDTELRNFKDKVFELETSVDEKRNSLHEINDQLSKSAVTITQQKNLIKTLNSKKVDLDGEIKILNSKNDEMESEISDLKLKLSETSKLLEDEKKKNNLQDIVNKHSEPTEEKILNDCENAAIGNGDSADVDDKYQKLLKQNQLLKDEIKKNEDKIIFYQNELQERDDKIKKFTEDMLPMIQNHFSKPN